MKFIEIIIMTNFYFLGGSPYSVSCLDSSMDDLNNITCFQSLYQIFRYLGNLSC